MIYTYLATAVIAALMASAGTWKVQSWRFDSMEKERLESIERDRRFAEKRVDVSAEGHEKDKARIQSDFAPITKEVERVVEKPVYRNVCLDDDGLRVLSRAIAGPPAASEPAPAVPRSEPAE